jgi:hypothetical protein
MALSKNMDLLVITPTRVGIFAQKLEYMHNNTLQEKWKLCKSPIEYKFSSAKFYETGTDELFILSNGII